MRDDPLPLRELLDDAGRRTGIGNPGATARLWRGWRAIAGEEIAAHAEPTSLREGILRLRVSSPAWATEISYLAADIRARINEALGAEIVTEVRVWTAAPGDPGQASRPAPAASPRPTADVVEKDRPAGPDEALERARKAWAAARAKGR